MNPLTLIPAKARKIMYALLWLLGPLVAYAATVGWIGSAEVALYGGYCTLVGLTAQAHVSD